ncbi:MAG: PRC-barrel domain-containing protein [Anaerolineae bacterium]|nr:PRC-barrel domain-containing protein [Anaerolineae bacterium]
MLLSKKYIGKQVISVDEGRIVGEVKDFYIDRDLNSVTGLYFGSEGLIKRKALLLKHEHIMLFGVDVIFIDNAGAVTDGDTVEGIDNWMRRDDLIGRAIISETSEAKIGKVDDIFFDETGKLLGLGLSNIEVKGPIAENRAISRAVIKQTGDKDNPMVIDLFKAEQQHWFFEERA